MRLVGAAGWGAGVSYTLLCAPCSGHPARGTLLQLTPASTPGSRRAGGRKKEGGRDIWDILGKAALRGKRQQLPCCPDGAGGRLGFKVGAKRATHKRAAGEGWRSLAGGKGRRNLAVAPGSLLVSAATAGTRGPLLLTAMGTARTASPAPSQAAAGGTGAVPRSSSGGFRGFRRLPVLSTRSWPRVSPSQSSCSGGERG